MIYLRSQVERFVILFVERSGSTYLLTALKAQPTVLARTEKFDAMRQDGKDGGQQLEWARQFLTPPIVGLHRAVGFKTKLVDVLDPEGFARLLKEHESKVVQLQRRNTVKAVISTINARRQWEASGNWNLLDESTRLPAFEVNMDEFELLLREREALDESLDRYVGSLELPTLRLSYEDLLSDRGRFVERTLRFLGVEAKPHPGATLKNTDDDLSRAILNFDELRRRCEGTRYEAMLHEGFTLA